MSGLKTTKAVEALKEAIMNGSVHFAELDVEQYPDGAFIIYPADSPRRPADGPCRCPEDDTWCRIFGFHHEVGD